MQKLPFNMSVYNFYSPSQVTIDTFSVTAYPFILFSYYLGGIHALLRKNERNLRFSRMRLQAWEASGMGVQAQEAWGEGGIIPSPSAGSSILRAARAFAAAPLAALGSRAFRPAGALRRERSIFGCWRYQRGVEGLLVEIIQQHS